jgi:hypothetical protein
MFGVLPSDLGLKGKRAGKSAQAVTSALRDSNSLQTAELALKFSAGRWLLTLDLLKHIHPDSLRARFGHEQQPPRSQRSPQIKPAKRSSHLGDQSHWLEIALEKQEPEFWGILCARGSKDFRGQRRAASFEKEQARQRQLHEQGRAVEKAQVLFFLSFGFLNSFVFV